MAYDHHVAICNLLCYPHIMNKRASFQLSGASWFSGILVTTVQMTWIFSLTFCEPNEVNHFCDASPMLELACTDTHLFEIETLTATVLFVMFPFLRILISYAQIITTILRMLSEEGRHKAFFTCSSHLMVMLLFYDTASSTYFSPKSSYSPQIKKVLSFFYTVITPMLNPIIYSLRNKEVKGALGRILDRKLFLQNM